MLISTSAELRQYMPSIAMENIDSMSGYLNNSEHDFLMDKIGNPLHQYLSDKYAEMVSMQSTNALLAHSGTPLSPAYELITLCQRCIVFDAFARSTNIRAVSVNANGFNQAVSDDYSVSDGKAVDKFKQQCVTEAHAAVNRLLVQLEDWAKEVAAVEPKPEPPTPQPENPVPQPEENEVVPTAGETGTEVLPEPQPEGPADPLPEPPAEIDANLEEKKEIIVLWKQSKYFYQVEGLLINTATTLSLYVDIYESRERFVQMLPDLRFIQDMVVAPEIGADLLDDLLTKMRSGQGNATEKTTIMMLQRTMALHLEDRNRFFTREAAHSEAIQSMKIVCEYIDKHQDQLDPKAMEDSPLKKKPINTPERTHKWKNNRKGNVMFVVKPIS